MYIQPGIGDDLGVPWYAIFCPFMPTAPFCILPRSSSGEIPPPSPKAAQIVSSVFGDAAGDVYRIISDAVYSGASGKIPPEKWSAFINQGHVDLMKACKGDVACYNKAVAEFDDEVGAAAGSANPNKPWEFPWTTLALVGGGVIGALILSKAVKTFV